MENLNFNGGSLPAYEPALQLQQRLDELVSPKIREMLQLRYDFADTPVAIIGAAPVPVMLRNVTSVEEGAAERWELTNPWWTVTFDEDDELFEGRLLTELARMRNQVAMAFVPVDKTTVN